MKKHSSTSGQASSIVVGVGASAGGLEAMTLLLKNLPADPGMAIVLVQHLDPTHESALTALLSRATSIPVQEAHNNMLLAPNHVYVIPPNKVMVVSGRRLRLSPRKDARDFAMIDQFLRSLAEAEGSRAIGVILSGSSGSDGTQGLLAIKTAGGITFAQDEKTAKYPSMPAAAVAAGCVDFVLPPEKIARELLRLAGHPYVAPSKEREGAQPAEERWFEDILGSLRRLTGVDFTHYKHATLRRRIQRRMALNKIESLKGYAALVHTHAGEARELFNDVLIHVTGFFRDPIVFRTLKRKVLPRLLKNRTPDSPIRIWVPGCSTGEEVYSLAMSILEFIEDSKSHIPVQIFGTDINENALEKARAGIYPAGIQTDVSVERLRRFFVKTEGAYRINKSIREVCIFARQNVVIDPPFSNIDLISCRNLLIYLGTALQHKVIPMFHYALRPAGFLLLGSSETVGGFGELFGLVDKKSSLYGKKATEIRPVMSFGHRATQPTFEAQEIPGGLTIRPTTGPSITDVQKYADRIVLSQHSPPGVVVDRQLEVLQFRGRTGPYLEHAHGEATLNLYKMAREGLMVGLRSAVSRAIKQNVRIREEDVRVRQDSQSVLVDIEVIPFQVPPERDRYYLILFDQHEARRENQGRNRGKRDRGVKDTETLEVTRLREEIAETRESLQAVIEEQEATNEELRSANEEIMSSNEELQSTNEELETAKEELQSTNEELSTLNDELESRNSELENVNNDLHNLMGSVNIPIIMVGSDLRIRRFTAVAEKLLNLIPTDIGRPLTDINLKLTAVRLGQIVREVIDSLQPRELEAQDSDQRWWSVRIRPYRTTDNKIDGAVVAFVDVDLIKVGVGLITRQRKFLDEIVKTVRHPLLVLDKDLSVLSANALFYKAFQVTAGETVNKRIYELGNGQWNIPKLRTLLEDILPNRSSFEGFEVDHTFPLIGRKQMVLNARRLSLERDGIGLILLAIEDVSVR